MEDLLSRGVLPVICGGTNYYIESILWKVLIDQARETSTKTDIPREDGNNDDDVHLDKRAKFDVTNDEFQENEEVTDAELHEKLRSVDPERANEVHPNDRRKVARSLEGTRSVV